MTFCYFIMITFLLIVALVSSNQASLPEEAREDACEQLDEEYQDRLREELRDGNCLREVEVVEPQDIQRAKRLFFRDGFVVIGSVLPEEQMKALRVRNEEIANKLLERDPKRIGNRGPNRYSFGPPHGTGHCLHYQEFADLVDVPLVTPIIKAIFGNDEFIARGARGDFNLPGAPYQDLHGDIRQDYLHDPAETEYTDSGRLNLYDLPVFYVVANYVMANITALNAPIRQIPGTQNLHRPMPLVEDEPLWMKRSTLCPIPAGSAILRDPRAWHGGTPNLSDGPRYMPNVEYYAHWYRFHGPHQMVRSMPREIYNNLSPFGKKLSREIVALPGEELDTSFADEVTMLSEHHLACYKRLGVTEEDIQRHKDTGRYMDAEPARQTPRRNFYQRTHKPTTEQ